MKHTRWSLLGPAEREAMTRTLFASPCAYCDVMLVTEADFAKHFVVSDPTRYLNLGACPNEVHTPREVTS